ncbi:hypothetical protein PZB75_18640 [Streptomyces sp. AM 4-1-1]|uniref:hypothetical protein n=1 Tax=Streptomyces sp. AM 4-1-1 TaxID=3028710 RepID=UPI0023B9EAAD|nr:hypothetical protein [Streptomyces sp. AM 4-1-1]WEH35200.1 hypothetical protein PZB75_18640 [Streptomyces sp. AM 4-1-1]
MRPLRIASVLALLTATLSTTATATAATSPPASPQAQTTAAAPAASADFDLQVTRKAAEYKDIPGTELTFAATAGERSYLWSRNLSVTNVTPLSSGDNIGNTFAVRCRYADGSALPAGTEAGSYWAANLVPPGETSLVPSVRWVFEAPTAGQYRCRLSIVSYSSIIVNGRTVTMRVPAGAELARAQYATNARWTLPEANSTVVPTGVTATTLGYTVTPTGPDRIAVLQDAALTACVPGSTICGGGTSTSTSVETWIEAQPQTADGVACGTPVKGPVAQWVISNAKHHLSAANTLYLTKSQLRGCDRFRASLKVRNIAGNPVKVHGGHADGEIAATHGLAFTY